MPQATTGPLQPLDDFLKLIEIAVGDVDGTALAFVIDAHLEAERIAEALFQSGGVGILDRSGARAACGAFAHEFLHLPHIESARDDIPRQCLGIGVADQRAAWPAESSPPRMNACTGSGSLSRRSMLATWLRLLPTIWRSSSWLWPNSSISRR